jgi:hypothetical protein
LVEGGGNKRRTFARDFIISEWSHVGHPTRKQTDRKMMESAYI